MTMSQAPSESVQDYFLKVCKCRPSNLDEEWVKSLAVRGLKDSIRTIVMPQNTKTLDEARQMALLAEETLNLLGVSVAACQSSPFEVAAANSRPAPVVRPVVVTAPTPPSAPRHQLEPFNSTGQDPA